MTIIHISVGILFIYSSTRIFVLLIVGEFDYEDSITYSSYRVTYVKVKLQYVQ